MINLLDYPIGTQFVTRKGETVTLAEKREGCPIYTYRVKNKFGNRWSVTNNGRQYSFEMGLNDIVDVKVVKVREKKVTVPSILATLTENVSSITIDGVEYKRKIIWEKA